MVLIRSFQARWAALANTCAESVKAATLAMLQEAIDKHFGRYETLKWQLGYVTLTFSYRQSPIHSLTPHPLTACTSPS